jgi:uncharacterized protein (TIGR02757 family)
LTEELIQLLNNKAAQYNHPDFIAKDPIIIPHRFGKQQDKEISGFFAAILAWGNRTTIIQNTNQLIAWMDESPHDFIVNHQEQDLKKMIRFVHRTFNATDLLYFIEFLKYHYQKHPSLEDAFVPSKNYLEPNVEQALIHFHNYFFSLADFPSRTKKHIATPSRKSACKRLNMYLRWMVRKDKKGVDFGIWKKIKPSQLVCPLDVHVANVAHRFGLIPNTQSNWKNAVHLTEQLQFLNQKDPTIYDFALFGLGAEERFNGTRN